ncbi:MAG: tRNA (guanine(46)-N(7))-methyltransferase TrmB [Polyangiales bacterium]
MTTSPRALTPPHPRKSRLDDPYKDAPQLPGAWDETCEVRAIFPTAPADAPIELEIGGGRGGFAFERLAAAPEICLLGLEIKRKWATIVDRRLAAAGLGGRGRVFAEDARRGLPRLSPSASVRAVFLHFPDPWWKKKHEKRLVLGDDVQEEIERLLILGGALFVQTDVEHRFEQYRRYLDTRPALAPAGDREGDPTLAENPYGARSPREHRAIEDGLPIFRLRYTRRA